MRAKASPGLWIVAASPKTRETNPGATMYEIRHERQRWGYIRLVEDQGGVGQGRHDKPRNLCSFQSYERSGPVVHEEHEHLERGIEKSPPR
jgi:hypothetical protein